MDELNIKLIDLVESEPCIYDKTDVFYSNKDHVKQVWEKISGELNLSVAVCQKRWRYLRDYFVRQLHMSKTDNKKSFWALFERMLFLAPFSTRKTRVNASSIECCATTTTILSNNNRKSRKKRQHSTSTVIKKWDTDRNTLSASETSSNTECDEFNSLDYLNLYQAQFGFADNAALLQLQKQRINFPQDIDDRISSLPLEIQIQSPFELGNNTIMASQSAKENDIMAVKPTITSTNLESLSQEESKEAKQNLIAYNLVSTSTNNIEISNDANFTQQVSHKNLRKHINLSDSSDRVHNLEANYQNSALLAVESYYSNSDKSLGAFQSNFNEEKNNIRLNNFIKVKSTSSDKQLTDRKQPSKGMITDVQDVRKPDFKRNSASSPVKGKRQTMLTRPKKSQLLNELLGILRKPENTNCDEHDYFFRSLLNNVRRIDENLILPFRTEILKTVLKFRDMSNRNSCSTSALRNSNNQSDVNLVGFNIMNNFANSQSSILIQNSVEHSQNLIVNDNEDGDDDDVVIIDTGESNWRQKLKHF